VCNVAAAGRDRRRDRASRCPSMDWFAFAEHRDKRTSRQVVTTGDDGGSFREAPPSLPAHLEEQIQVQIQSDLEP